MKLIKYTFEFIIIILLFLIFKIVGLRISRNISGFIFKNFGSFFRSKKTSRANLSIAFPNFSEIQKDKILDNMWINYGKIFAEYMFIKKFRYQKENENIIIEGKEILKDIKRNNQKVVFISGHFSNFELMAMEIEKAGINLAAIYRPLNNIFLNFLMEKIRKNYICKKQIKKGIGGVKELVKLNKEGYSTALMIDQRVSEGIKLTFFNEEAFTTTIPAQLVKKFKTPVVPIFIERYEGIKFKMIIHKPLNFLNNDSTEDITLKLNKILEKMIIENPQYWIWSHNRWK